MKGDRHISQMELVEKRKVIMAALTSAMEDVPAPENSSNEPALVTGEYYSLTQEDIEALINGDVERIKSWVSTLDKQKAAWLLHRLIDDRW